MMTLAYVLLLERVGGNDMKSELIKLLNERVALLRDQTARDARETYEIVAAPDEDTHEHSDEEREVETMLVDFDYDIKNQNELDTYMTLRYFWIDWSNVITDIY